MYQKARHSDLLVYRESRHIQGVKVDKVLEAIFDSFDLASRLQKPDE